MSAMGTEVHSPTPARRPHMTYMGARNSPAPTVYSVRLGSVSDM